ncbi:MAG: hypothetical protein WKF52_05920 [Sphingomicrobium sp.]
MAKPGETDPETEELINRLLTRVGILMEDASTCALITAPCAGGVAERVNRVGQNVERMPSICAAAKALLDG